MAQIYQQAPSLNGIDATNDALNPLLVQAEFDSTIDSLTTIQSVVNVFSLGCSLLDIATGINYKNIGTTAAPVFGIVENISVIAQSPTIATTGNTDTYIIAPNTGVLSIVRFSATSGLATSDTNYLTWSMTNLGQAGAGSTAMLATTPAGINTTKATGGAAIVANTKKILTLSATPANLNVVAGDRILIRAAATGTLANTVTFPVYLVKFD